MNLSQIQQSQFNLEMAKLQQSMKDLQRSQL